MVSCQKGPIRHACAWQIWPFWQDTLYLHIFLRVVSLALKQRDCSMGLLPDTWNCRLRMRRECRERFPLPPISENRLLAIPACITARAWRTCRDACRDCLHAVTGKTFPAFPAHAHPQFYVSGKRPIVNEVALTDMRTMVGTQPQQCANRVHNFRIWKMCA